MIYEKVIVKKKRTSLFSIQVTLAQMLISSPHTPRNSPPTCRRTALPNLAARGLSYACRAAPQQDKRISSFGEREKGEMRWSQVRYSAIDLACPKDQARIKTRNGKRRNGENEKRVVEKKRTSLFSIQSDARTNVDQFSPHPSPVTPHPAGGQRCRIWLREASLPPVMLQPSKERF